MGIGCTISSVAGAEQQHWTCCFKCSWRWAALGCTRCAILSVAGAAEQHQWVRRFNCLLMENSAGANSNFTTPVACATYSLYRVLQDVISQFPRDKGIQGRDTSQLPHSCVCERFIYSHHRSPYSAGGNMYRSQTHEC